MLGIFPSKVSPRRKQRLGGWILIVCLGVCVQPASAQGAAAEVINAEVGQTVTLTAPVTVNTFSIAWYRGTVVADPQLICTYFVTPPSQITGPQYTGRETCDPDGSLQIRDLLSNYTGNYTVTVTPNGARPITATRQLMVFVKNPNEESNNGLSGGAIAGIVIAAVVVLAGVAVLVYIFVFKKPASGAAAMANSTEMAPKNKEGSASPKANGAAPEIQYSSVNFVPKREKPVSPENTVYSEVRR